MTKKVLTVDSEEAGTSLLTVSSLGEAPNALDPTFSRKQFDSVFSLILSLKSQANTPSDILFKRWLAPVICGYPKDPYL